MKYSNKQIDKLISGIYDGEITVGDMPESLYYAIADYLKKSLYEGFGGSLIDFDGKPLELLTELRENIYLFSGAKTYQTVKAMESMLTEDGEKRSFKDFKDFARNEYDLFNVTWAQTEYDTAIGQGQNAYLWSKIQADKDVLPLLQYSAVIDANTSDICAPLDGIVKPVDDPFWDVFMPLNHYNCRCSVLQLSEGEISKDVKEETKQVAENMNDVFKNNVGKDGFVFPPDHPYFDVAPEDKKLAKENFGFDIPEKDNEKGAKEIKEIEFIPAKTIAEAEDRIKSMDINLGAKSMKLEHLNKTLEALETVPTKARPTAIYDKAGYEQNFGRKINRKASEFQGMALKSEVFDKKAMQFKEEKVLVINSREFKLPSDISERKIKYNEFYKNQKDGNSWYLNTFDGSTHYHEMGHLYDVNISNKKEWVDISNKWYSETKADMIKVSKGGDFSGENGSEAFAEAFASYFGNNKKGLPDYIVDYFDKNIK